MTPETVFEEVTAILARYVPQTHRGARLTPDARLEDLGIDSPQRIDILLDTEDRFRISIEESRFERVATLGDLAGLVIDSTAASASA